VLLLLLLVSIAMNVVQARQGTRLEGRLDEFELALDQAVARLDQQTARALEAEGALSDVDTAMQTVRARIAGLQQALDELDSATRP
jgi:chromosome segregation ATPase